MPDARLPPLVVIGGSAGAVVPLRRIVADLPADFPAAVCVVVHVPSEGRSALAHVLADAGVLPAAYAEDRAPLVPGQIAVAPPGHHLLVHDGHVTLSDGARENGARPAIDPLFRSAARGAGSGVVAVLLSGTLDDGSAGMAAVARAGGLTIVQDPDDAQFPDMPRNALGAAMRSRVLPASAIAAELVAAVEVLARAGGHVVPSGSSDAVPPAPRDLAEPAADSVDRGLAGPALDLPGTPSPYSCPACGGVLYDRPDHQYLCRLGHRYSPLALAAHQRDVVEDALWLALRALEESASLQARVRDRAARRGDEEMERRFEERRKVARERAERIRNVLRTFGADESAVGQTEP